MEAMEAHYLDVPDVMRILGVSRNTVYRWIDKGELEARRFGKLLKIPASAVDIKMAEVTATNGHEMAPLNRGATDRPGGPTLSNIRARLRIAEQDITTCLRLLEEILGDDEEVAL